MAMKPEDTELPEELELNFKREAILRYGENSHQKAALYLDANNARPGAARARQVQGKELSYNNLQDADAAFECVAEFSDPAVVIVKHMNPCGVALGKDMRETYAKALACDPVSAFGGIVALNRAFGAAVAEELLKLFVEVVIAPEADEDALEVMKKKPNVRVLLTGGMPDPLAPRTMVHTVAGGLLVQDVDSKVLDGEPRVVTKRTPTEQEMADMKFAYAVVKHVKSNAIVYAKDGATIGIGAGQMSRVISSKIAAMKAADAKLSLKGSVMASDAFFPFPDTVETAAQAGATAVIQPGGSIKDQDSVDAADKAGMAMVFAGVRHFRH
ncbi:bifunctional phosphoribosylaminoimidazolecarboxamide formyltransferase/IMP cyclohydrolase [Candidatus Kaiserbacteria bacterium]|nr:bifunctional phosphoribosylaminoimidazolecarboxamide formyltransferase/IMP cyclohydrolase [Candidatus Kaiserbacteria bacterium]